jgi:hypothetical protein
MVRDNYVGSLAEKIDLSIEKRDPNLETLLNMARYDKFLKTRDICSIFFLGSSLYKINLNDLNESQYTLIPNNTFPNNPYATLESTYFSGNKKFGQDYKTLKGHSGVLRYRR